MEYSGKKNSRKRKRRRDESVSNSEEARQSIPPQPPYNLQYLSPAPPNHSPSLQHNSDVSTPVITYNPFQYVPGPPIPNPFQFNGFYTLPTGPLTNLYPPLSQGGRIWQSPVYEPPVVHLSNIPMLAQPTTSHPLPNVSSPQILQVSPGVQDPPNPFSYLPSVFRAMQPQFPLETVPTLYPLHEPSRLGLSTVTQANVASALSTINTNATTNTIDDNKEVEEERAEDVIMKKIELPQQSLQPPLPLETVPTLRTLHEPSRLGLSTITQDNVASSLSTSNTNATMNTVDAHNKVEEEVLHEDVLMREIEVPERPPLSPKPSTSGEGFRHDPDDVHDVGCEEMSTDSDSDNVEDNNENCENNNNNNNNHNFPPDEPAITIERNKRYMPDKNDKKPFIRINEISVNQRTSSLCEREYFVRIHNQDYINGGLDEAFRTIARELLRTARELARRENFHARFAFQFRNAQGDPFNVCIPYRWITDESVESAINYILARLEKMFQSGCSYSFNIFKVNIAVFKPAKGHKFLKGYAVNFLGPRMTKNHLYKKLSNNKGGTLVDQKGCGFLAVRFAYWKFVEKKKFTRAGQLDVLIRRSQELAAACGLDFNMAVGPAEFEKMEKHLNVRLYVFTHDDSPMKFLRNVYVPRNPDRAAEHIIVGHSGEHYFPVRNITDAVSFKYSGSGNPLCTGCSTFHSNLAQHKLLCGMVCSQCHDEKCTRKIPEGEAMISCEGCLRQFYNQDCYDNHKRKVSREKLNTCDKVKCCAECETVHTCSNGTGHSTHDCKKVYCRNCKKSYDNVAKDGPHFCFMSKATSDEITHQNKTPKKAPKRAKLNVVSIYYDIETYIRVSREEGTRGKEIRELIPYCLVAQTTCYLCNKIEPKNPEYKDCKKCGKRTTQYTLPVNDNTHDYGDPYAQNGPVDQFIAYLIEFSNMHKGNKIRVIAHNGSGFDFQFIFKQLLLHMGPSIFSDDPLVRGRKLIKMAINNNVEFRDSFLFSQCSLANFPRTMGIKDLEVSKSFFPYTFLTEKTLNYVGDIPARNFFEPDKMNATTREEFNKFYSTFGKNDYDIQKECLKYCENDVMVLRLCFDEYREQIMEEFEIDPALSVTTIASLVHRIYKKNFMPENKIGIIDRNITHSYSYEAIRWLRYCEETLKIKNLHHARNGGEVVLKIKNKLHYPDGFCKLDKEFKPIDETSNDENKCKGTVFMFHGCFYHGHPIGECTKIDQERHLGGVSHTDRYTRTAKALARLEAANYNVITMWECEWKAKKKNEIMADGKTVGEYVKELMSTTNVDKILHVGDSLFGGRTNPFVFYYPPTEGVKIHYMDFTSLYPYVQKNNYFPVGRPTHFIKDIKTEEYLKELEDKYFGLALIKILPPQDLYMPVLPVSLNHKLVFPLCYACGKKALDPKNYLGEEEDELEEGFISPVCSHTEEQRAIKGVYTTPEIKLAIEKGYVLQKVEEVWGFEKDNTLFAGYVNHFLKQKTEASGYPATVITEADKDAYIKAYEDYEGVKLDKKNIAKNPGRRFIAKLALNSLWGKFAQRIKDGQMKLCKDDYEAEELVRDGTKEVTQLEPIFQGYLARYNHSDYAQITSACTNIPIASFTTAYARVKLYKLLESLGERVLYTDTDSVIFISRKNDTNPATGVYLGDLTNEITDEYGQQAYADSFVSTAPKSYALRILVPKEDGAVDFKYIVRSKGICLNAETKDIINFGSMVSLIVDDGGRQVEDVALRELTPLDHKWLDTLEENEKEDVTVKAIQDVIRENSTVCHEGDDAALIPPHIANNCLSDNLVNHLNVNNESGALQLNVPNHRLQACKFGGMVSLDGTKLFQVTGKKRYLIPKSFRSVPFGFTGEVHCI